MDTDMIPMDTDKSLMTPRRARALTDTVLMVMDTDMIPNPSLARRLTEMAPDPALMDQTTQQSPTRLAAMG